MIRHDPEALALWTEATRGRQDTRTDIVDNVNEVNGPDRPTGTSREQALRRLNKLAGTDERAAEVRERVLRGETSPHGAMVELGLRQRTITIPIDPGRAAAAIRRAFLRASRSSS